MFFLWVLPYAEVRAQSEGVVKQDTGAGIAISIGAFRASTLTLFGASPSGYSRGTMVSTGEGPCFNFSVGNIYSPYFGAKDNSLIWGINLGLGGANGTSNLSGYLHGYDGMVGGDPNVDYSNLESRPGYSSTSQLNRIILTGAIGIKIGIFPKLTIGVAAGAGIDQWGTNTDILFQEQTTNGTKYHRLRRTLSGTQLAATAECYVLLGKYLFVAVKGTAAANPFAQARLIPLSVGSATSVSVSVGGRIPFQL